MVGPMVDSRIEQSLRVALRGGRDGPAEGCPDTAALAAYVDQGLEASERSALERHLADCTPCLDTVVATSRTNREPGPEVPARLIARAAASAEEPSVGASHLTKVAAAAALLMALGVTWWTIGPGTNEAIPSAVGNAVRSDAPAPMDSKPTISEPADGSPVKPPFTVRWSPVADAIDYELLLTDANGNLVWEHRTDETFVTTPADLSIGRTADHFLWVRVRFTDGESRSSEPILLRVGPSPVVDGLD